MTIRQRTSRRPNRTAPASGYVSLHSMHYKQCNPRASPSCSWLLAAHQRPLKAPDIEPSRNERSGHLKTKTRIVPATGQPTHSHG